MSGRWADEVDADAADRKVAPTRPVSAPLGYSERPWTQCASCDQAFTSTHDVEATALLQRVLPAVARTAATVEAHDDDLARKQRTNGVERRRR